MTVAQMEGWTMEKQTITNKEVSDKQIVSHLRGETHEACLKIKALQRRRRDINSEAS